MHVKKYPYGLKTKKAFFLAIACILFIVIGYHAANEGRGLIIDHLITLTPGQAKIFWLSSSGFFALAGIRMISLCLYTLKNHPELSITENHISIPKTSPFSEATMVRFCDLESFKHTKVKSTHFLTLYTIDGKKHVIAANMLPSKADFDAIMGFLHEVVQ